MSRLRSGTLFCTLTANIVYDDSTLATRFPEITTPNFANDEEQEEILRDAF